MFNNGHIYLGHSRVYSCYINKTAQNEQHFLPTWRAVTERDGLLERHLCVVYRAHNSQH